MRIDIRRPVSLALGGLLVAGIATWSVTAGARQATMADVLIVYEDALRDRTHEVARLDARYGSGVAVRWRPDGERPMTGDEALAKVAGK